MHVRAYQFTFSVAIPELRELTPKISPLLAPQLDVALVHLVAPLHRIYDDAPCSRLAWVVHHLLGTPVELVFWHRGITNKRTPLITSESRLVVGHHVLDTPIVLVCRLVQIVV